MNPFNNNTQNLSQSDLSKRKRLETINICCKKNQENTKLKMGASSINNTYNKKNEGILKSWNEKFTDICGNFLNSSNENMFRNPEYYASYIEIDFNKKVLNNKN